jgi:hypothetical protein
MKGWISGKEKGGKAGVGFRQEALFKNKRKVHFPKVMAGAQQRTGGKPSRKPA